jgi:hypothetical protein
LQSSALPAEGARTFFLFLEGQVCIYTRYEWAHDSSATPIKFLRSEWKLIQPKSTPAWQWD